MLRVVFWVAFLFFLSQAATAQTYPAGCSNPSEHGQADSPHTQGTDDPDVDDQCHGKPGDAGTCAVGQGQQTASVLCEIAIEPGRTFQYCEASLSCPSPGGSCRGTSVIGGIDHITGHAYVECQLANGTYGSITCN